MSLNEPQANRRSRLRYPAEPSSPSHNLTSPSLRETRQLLYTPFLPCHSDIYEQTDTPQLGWNKENHTNHFNIPSIDIPSITKDLASEFSTGSEKYPSEQTERYMNNQFSFCDSQVETPRMPLVERIQEKIRGKEDSTEKILSRLRGEET